MNNKQIWLIYYKASIGDRSSLNMDGSEFAEAVGVVNAENITEAIIALQKYLLNDYMDIIEISKCEIFNPDNFSDSSENSVEIKNAAAQAKKKNEIVHACGVSSKALAHQEETNKGNAR